VLYLGKWHVGQDGILRAIGNRAGLSVRNAPCRFTFPVKSYLTGVWV